MYFDYDWKNSAKSVPDSTISPPQNAPKVEAVQNEIVKPHSKLLNSLKICSAVLLIATGAVGYQIYHKYRQSLNWSTNRDSLKMADMPIDTLTDTGSQLKYKENFLVQYQKMYHADGSITATHQSINKLANELKKIKTAKPIYQAKFNRVNEKYQIQAKLNSLFADSKHTQIKQDLTSADVQRVLANDLAPHLNTLHEKNSHDAFVKANLKEVHHLYDDCQQITNLTTQILEIATINQKKQTIMFNENVVPDNYDKINQKFSNLHYKWLYMDHYFTMQEAIDHILAQQQDKINQYNDYMNDLHDKANAYNDLRKQHLARQKAYFDKIRKREEEKEEKAREKREAEKQAQKEREEEQKEENDDSNSNSKQNNSHESSHANHHSSSSASSSQNTAQNNQSQQSASQSSNNNTSSTSHQSSQSSKANNSTKPKRHQNNNDNSYNNNYNESHPVSKNITVNQNNDDDDSDDDND